MKHLISIGLLCLCSTLLAEREAPSLNMHERILYKKIMNKVPTLNTTYALKVSQEIYSASVKYGVPYAYIQSIFFIESTYRLDAVNKDSGDFGIGQVSTWNIKTLKLDKKRLLTDLKYSVNESVNIMQWFYKTYRDKEPNEWIGRYNCGTKPSCVRWKSVKRYVKKVQENL